MNSNQLKGLCEFFELAGYLAESTRDTLQNPKDKEAMLSTCWTIASLKAAAILMLEKANEERVHEVSNDVQH